MIRRLLIGTAWFFLGILPIVVLLAAVAFASYPGETEAFSSLLINAASVVYIYAAIPGVALIIGHELILSRIKNDRQTRLISVLAGASLGALFGLLLMRVLVWATGALILAIVAGALYGLAIGLCDRGAVGRAALTDH